MQRRTLLTATALGACTLALPAYAQDLNEAINKAGRQRMLSQRMSKAWLALLLNVEKTAAQQVLDKSLIQFDKQLTELRAFNATPEVQTTYTKLDAAWTEYKTLLTSKAPARDAATAVLQQDAKVLALAHQGTQQLEAFLAKPLGKLVNLAGRQRMLSQRMAKFYLATTLPVDAANAGLEISRAHDDFVSAMRILRTAPETTPRIKNELGVADAQWVFFETALQNLQEGAQRPRAMSDIFLTSENMLNVMERVTDLYVSAKA